jgi:hypothetical protein
MTIILRGDRCERAGDERPRLGNNHRAAYGWRLEHLQPAVTAVGIALWAWNVDTDLFMMDGRGFEVWGLPWREVVTFEELSEHIHPADRTGYDRPLPPPGPFSDAMRPISVF